MINFSNKELKSIKQEFLTNQLDEEKPFFDCDENKEKRIKDETEIVVV